MRIPGVGTGYQWSEYFQIRLLAVFARRPKQKIPVKPQYFTGSPILVDIARVISELREQHPDVYISKTTLKELVRASLGKKEENWGLYKDAIRRMYQTRLNDVPILVREAGEFSKEARAREALVQMERHITNRHYEAADEAWLEAKASTNGHLREWDLDDLPHPEDFPAEKLDWVIPKILPVGAVIALSGDEGTGKTFTALGWARAITNEWRPVVYLCPDVSKAQLHRYLSMMRWRPNECFRILSFWTGEDKQVPMFDSKDVEKLYKLAEAEHPVFIADTVRDIFSGDENASGEVQPVMNATRILQGHGSEVVLLAHPPKSGSSLIRGSGVLAQKVDIPYLMRKDKWQGKEVWVLTCPKKNRFGSTSFSLAIEPRFLEMPNGIPWFYPREIPNWKPSEDMKADLDKLAVFEVVKTRPGLSEGQIAESVGISEKTARRHLWEGHRMKILRYEAKTAHKRGGRRLLWYPSAE